MHLQYAHVKSLSRVRLFAAPWTVAHQTPPSLGFSTQDTGVGCHFLLQEIFPTQGLNPGLPHCRQMLYHLSHQGNYKQNKNTAYKLGENICKQCDQQGINFQNIQTAYTAQLKKKS